MYEKTTHGGKGAEESMCELGVGKVIIDRVIMPGLRSTRKIFPGITYPGLPSGMKGGWSS